MIEETRIQPLNEKQPVKGEYVLYWMQASQRAKYNHALEYALAQANRLKQPLLVYFGLTEGFPEANKRHYHFMLEGLNDVRKALKDRGIGMVIARGSPETGAEKYARKASLAVCDRGYLKIQRQWRRYAAANLECPLLEVESDVIIPIETASGKEEYSAATLRRKLLPLRDKYLVPLPENTPVIDSTRLGAGSFDITDAAKAVSSLAIDHSVKPVEGFRGGTEEAEKRLDNFIDTKLDGYDRLRNDPNEDSQSGLSPYLHFGQISPLYIALRASLHGGPGKDAFLEELIVRRELSMNFARYNSDYDSYRGLPEWAIATLEEHKGDRRGYVYTPEELESAQTHDPYWNAAQKEMVTTGKMHGYMRMYWGKKILEWMPEPEKALTTALYLNNKYELDGRDPNSFTGVDWCFGKHDRPWGRRPIFGTVRYMNAAGLKRKFDADKYARKYT